MTSSSPRNERTWLFVGLLLIAFQYAAVAFISIVTTVNIPYEDDYDGILGFLRHYAALHGTSARALWMLTAQHTQYKLILLHSLIAAQYGLLGHVDLRAFQLLGDASLLVSGLLLWLYVRRSVSGTLARVWIYVPICYLFLAPIYWRNMNWALCSSSNLPVITFALIAFLFLANRSRTSAALMLISIALSVATAGNGFFVAFVALLTLLLQRRFRLAIGVFVLAVTLASVYAIGYHAYGIAPPLTRLQTMVALTVIPFEFLGDCGGHLVPSVLVGIVVLVVFLWLVKRGWHKTDPSSFATALFCVVTAFGVAITRHRFGWAAGLADRYRMYSVLLISLEFLSLARMANSPNGRPAGNRKSTSSQLLRSFRSSRVAVAVLVVGTILFGLRGDRFAYRALSARKAFLTIHLIEWERSPSSIVLVPDEEQHMKEPNWVEARSVYQAEFAQDVTLRLYVPPKAATDPLPSRPTYVF